MEVKDYYFCYDENQKNYLKKNDVKYITQARAMKTGKVFYLFESNDNLTRLITEYNTNIKNPQKGWKNDPSQKYTQNGGI